MLYATVIMQTNEMIDDIDEELKVIQEMFGDDFLELIALFRIDTPNRISDLGHAIIELDLERIKHLTHMLSGSASSIGARKLSLLCKNLEEKTKFGKVETMDAALFAIENEYHRIEAKLLTMVLSEKINVKT